MKTGKRSGQGSERDQMIGLNKENHGVRGSIAADKQRFSEMESASKTSKTKKKDKKEKKMKKKKSKKETNLLDSDQDEMEEDWQVDMSYGHQGPTLSIPVITASSAHSSHGNHRQSNSPTLRIFISDRPHLLLRSEQRVLGVVCRL